MATFKPSHQQTMLLEHFRAKKTLTPYEARCLYRIESLTSRVAELRRRGFRIRSEVFRDLTGKRFTRYTYLGLLP